MLLIAVSHPDFLIRGKVNIPLKDLAQGERPQLIESLHQILQWDVDFTAIWPKESFKLIFEKKYLDGEFVKYGEILAVQFVNRAGTYYAFLFENPQSSGYYQENGDGVRRPFLRAPFAFDRRITSRFSHSRYHPILKERRPHLGVDYGAPRGTPVLVRLIFHPKIFLIIDVVFQIVESPID